jgi:hypothetical protein
LQDAMGGVETAVSSSAAWVLGGDFKFKHGVDYTTSRDWFILQE